MKARPKVSPQDTVQSITVPLSVCLLPIVHPGGISSLGNATHTSNHTYDEQASSGQATFLHCSVIQFWCSQSHCRQCNQQWTGSAWARWPVCSNTGQFAESYYALCIQTPFFHGHGNFFSNLKSSSSVGSDQTAQPICIIDHVASSLVVLLFNNFRF